MAKLLIWVVVIGVALFGLRLLNVAKAKRRDTTVGGGSSRVPPAQATVRCVRCGVYLPSAEAKSGPEGMICGEPGCGKRQ